MNPRVFLDVDPRILRLPTARRSGADPTKLHRQIARFGNSIAGMPPLLVSSGNDGAQFVVARFIGAAHDRMNAVTTIETQCASK